MVLQPVITSLNIQRTPVPLSNTSVNIFKKIPAVSTQYVFTCFMCLEEQSEYIFLRNSLRLIFVMGGKNSIIKLYTSALLFNLCLKLHVSTHQSVIFRPVCTLGFQCAHSTNDLVCYVGLKKTD